MNDRTFRPGNIAAAAVVIGGVLIVFVPQHGMNIVRLVIVTVAAAAGLYVLAVNTTPAWWKSPFDPVRGARRRNESDELDRIRSKLAGRRYRIANGVPLPREIQRMLQPLIRIALERKGLDPDDRASLESARALMSPLTFAVLVSELPERPGWIALPARERATADLVHHVLDDLDRIAIGDTTRRTTSTPPTRE